MAAGVPVVTAPAPPIHIAVHDVSKQSWLGGTHYVYNLVRAVRSLPAGEQPRLTLLQSAWGDPGSHAEIGSLIEIVLAYPSEPGSRWTEFRRRVRQASLGRRYQTYSQVLRSHDVDVVFPLVRVPERQLPVPWVAWAWDLQHKYYPEHFPPGENARRDAVFADMAACAPLIVTSSRSALEDFDRFFPGAANRLRVLSFCTVPLPEWFAPDCEAVRTKHRLPARFLALPNAFWIHKNHRLAFEAIKRLSDEGLDVCLVCTGTTHDPRHPAQFEALMRFISANELEQQIRVLGVLPRSEQVQILRASAAILQPSLFEGWSTVVEDARALGKRIFLSDIRVHREQDPPGAVYFDPRDVESLAQAIGTGWSGLTPGPSVADEARARDRQPEIVSAFARRFIGVVSECVQPA